MVAHLELMIAELRRELYGRRSERKTRLLEQLESQASEDDLPAGHSATLEGRIAMSEKVIINIKTFVDGHTPPDRALETMF